MITKVASGLLVWSSKLRAAVSLRFLAVLLIILALRWNGYNTASSPGLRAAEREELCQLDSFSQPSLAMAILKQEADRLLANFVQRSNSPVSLRVDGQDPSAPDEIVCGVDWDTLRPIQQLRAELGSLECDLNRKLMLVYYENHLWNHFLDHYLHLLETEPQNSAIVIWQHCALSCSRRCGRTEEVVSRFEHLTRFHGELKTARSVKALLEELNLARSVSPESAAR